MKCWFKGGVVAGFLSGQLWFVGCNLDKLVLKVLWWKEVSFPSLSKLILGQEKKLASIASSKWSWDLQVLPSFSAARECILVDRTFFIELLCFNVPVQRYPRALRWGWSLGGAPQPSLTEPSSRVNKTCVKSWIFMAQSSPIESLIVCQGANLLFMVEILWVVPNNDDNVRDWPWLWLHQIRT